jgi:hypothetical protein
MAGWLLPPHPPHPHLARSRAGSWPSSRCRLSSLTRRPPIHLHHRRIMLASRRSRCRPPCGVVGRGRRGPNRPRGRRDRPRITQPFVDSAAVLCATQLGARVGDLAAQDAAATSLDALAAAHDLFPATVAAVATTGPDAVAFSPFAYWGGARAQGASRPPRPPWPLPSQALLAWVWA